MTGIYQDDVALARACAEGSPEAWERFIADYRPRLYAAARAIAGAERGRELADSLYAELYGLETRDGSRRSLFTYYQGRSSLITWLRAVLAQRHVDALRADARHQPLDEMKTEPVVHGSAIASDPDTLHLLAAVRIAVRQALACVAASDRLRLAWYYAHDLTLAEIARLGSEHESTVSRKLAKTRRQIRDAVERVLRERFAFSDDQIKDALQRVQEIDVGSFLERGSE
jgi:RNA polymerase sigma factor (sigma-70 family)